MPRSFRTYLIARAEADCPAGEFVAAAKADRRLSEAGSWAELESHLHHRGAAIVEIKAAKSVWRGYTKRRSRDANPRAGASG